MASEPIRVTFPGGLRVDAQLPSLLRSLPVPTLFVGIAAE